ncbi:hypothetical protein NIES22_67240 [Calothrix brevissima NIES-22]|nr:hypothetical protein NIES22_67240 [Calothrix brevissima NIES-22]
MALADGIRAAPIAFPQTSPPGYHYLPEEPTYNPAQHLSLKKPSRIYRLSDLGYDKTLVANCPTDVAITDPIRLLSESGVAALREVSLNLRQYKQRCDRIPNMVRGAAYRSRFIRDLCLCPIVTEFLSEIVGTPLAPHSMPLHLGHLNFAPENISEAVDRWHIDTISLDYVLMVSEPSALEGGKFQYFNGTQAEAAVILNHAQDLPPERVVSPTFPDAGYAIFQQGSMVVHRATRLLRQAERITLVNGYVPLDTSFPDQSRFADMKVVDEHSVLLPEWARHKAWLSRNKLDTLIEELPFTSDRAAICAALREAIADVEAAISDIEDTSESKMLYYGR